MAAGRLDMTRIMVRFKLGLHALQLQVEWSVTLVSSILVERRQVSRVARLQENKET